MAPAEFRRPEPLSLEHPEGAFDVRQQKLRQGHTLSSTLSATSEGRLTLFLLETAAVDTVRTHTHGHKEALF